MLDEIKADAVFGVIGVCGINGNLIARILSDNGYRVIANDTLSKDECRFLKALNDYPDIEVYHGDIPETFYGQIDYAILPMALVKSKSPLYQKITSLDIPVLTVHDICDFFEPTHPVICITGTNGKTTTTSLLKHLAYHDGIIPAEHNLEGMQGNAGDIPALQARLKSDVTILETGTAGVKGSLTNLAGPCRPDVGLITNITPDHLNESSSFIAYARVKSELMSLLEEGTLVANSDDPMIMALLEEVGYSGNLITFGMDYESTQKSTKECLCGKNVEIDEFIAGVGRYECDCGLKYTEPDYLACSINENHDAFTLKTPSDEVEFELAITGLHNIYNATGAIIIAHEILGISYESIRQALLTFGGVKGRMEKIATMDNRVIMVDYAHNPAGITTVLKELKNHYGRVVNVITTSSESGIEGDMNIMQNALEYADIVVPASYNSYICAKKLMNDDRFSDKIVLPEHMPKSTKVGTLGATLEQVLIGFNKSLDIDADLIVCTGEAAFKYKDKLLN
ncbi:MAG: Mur ligase family protein [Methanosphaera sp.]|nr:Mur ligase family protein [Methanosphaera sp.]